MSQPPTGDTTRRADAPAVERDGGDLPQDHRQLLDSIDEAITLHGPDGRIHYMNAAAVRLYAADDDPRQPAPDPGDWLVLDAAGQPLPPERWPVPRAHESGKPVIDAVLGLFRRSTRQLTWITVSVLPAATGDGAMLARARDVTALRRDVALFDRVQALANIGAWQWDRASARLHLTAGARRILGLRGAADRLHDFLGCLCDADRPELYAVLDTMQVAGAFDMVVRGHGQSGAARWMRIVGAPDPQDPGGNILSGTIEDISHRKQSEQAQLAQGQTDALTGLMNRDALLSRVASRLEHPASGRLALLHVNLDRFKTVNDLLGREGGDALLVEAANRLRRVVGGDGLVARFGGDEFLVACNAGDEGADPARLAARIREALGRDFVLGGTAYPMGASIGIALADHDVTSPEQLLQRADIAMREGKRDARTGIRLFSPELGAREQARVQTESQLRSALDNGEFHLVYQPQVDLRSGRILSAEALVRWRNPLLGEMRPDHFIALAETTGDIVRIGTWVLREACMQMQRWREGGTPLGRIAVNLSSRQIHAEDVAGHVRKILEDTGLHGEMLDLEVTERLLLEDADDTSATFDTLRALGVRLSIDDFGEGYSALNYLRRLPVHAIKLSPAFLRGVPGEPSDVAICQAIAGIARSLSLDIIAEGIENEAQRQFLLEQGITLGQGFLFAPGLPPDELASALAAQQDAR